MEQVVRVEQVESQYKDLQVQMAQVEQVVQVGHLAQVEQAE